MAGSRRLSGANTAVTTRMRKAAGANVVLGTCKRRLSGAWVDLFPTSTAATSDRIVTGATISPADATALYEINTDGKIYEAANNAPKTFVETWLVSGVSADFEVQAVVTSGTLTSGTANTWISLGSGAMGWTKTRTANTDGTDACIFTLNIRRVSDLVVVDTSTITLNATVTV